MASYTSKRWKTEKLQNVFLHIFIDISPNSTIECNNTMFYSWIVVFEVKSDLCYTTGKMF